MNYLAHLLLAGEAEGLVVGALLGDFVRGRVENLPFAPEVLAGIRLHRRIDVHTDAHRLTRDSRNRIGPARRRYAGIIVDLAYDHFLARHWSRFCAEPLEDFTSRRYSVLLAHRPALPAPLGELLPRMADEDWLGSYRELDNVILALERIGRRLRRGNGLLGVETDLRRAYPALEQDFLAFFPQLIQARKQWPLG